MNYTEIISQKLGTHVNDFNLDGQFYRFGKKDKLWAVGNEYVDGQKNSHIYFSCGDWSDPDKNFTYKSWEEKEVIVTTRMKNQLEKMHQDGISKINEETKKLQEEISFLSKKYIESLHYADPDNYYLTRKKLSEGFGVYKDMENLVFPIMDETKKIWSYQTIYPNGKKLMKKNGKKKGCFFHIGNIWDAKLILVAEGFSTAASVYMASQIPVMVAIDSGNIISAIKSIRKVNPGCKILICADRDENFTGEKAAEKCKKQLYAVSYVLPKGCNGSDFNDLHCEKGIEEVKKQIEIAKPKQDDAIKFLGFTDDEKSYCYFINETNSLKKLTPQEHNKANLFSIANEDYWGNRFNAYKIGEDGTKKLDFDFLLQKIFNQQKKAGRFNEKSILGYGVHRDNGAIAVNIGEKVFYKGNLIDIGEANSITNFYYKASNNMKIDFSKELSDDEGQFIIETFRHLRFTNKISYIYLAGWVAMAQIFGPLRWRPQIWIKGGKGTGKTTLMDTLKDVIPFSKNPRDPTAAGIVQNVGHSANVILYDEAETGAGKEKKMDDVLSIMRQSANYNSGEVWRGTSSGSGIKTNINVIFCFASIQDRIIQDADVSRIMKLEMSKKIPQTVEQSRKVVEGLSQISKMGDKLLTRMVNNFHVFEKNISIISDYISTFVKDARQVDQISPLIAGFHALLSRSMVSIAFLDEMAEIIKIGTTEYQENAGLSSSEILMNELLATIYDKSMNLTIMDAINNELKHDQLNSYGIKVTHDEIIIWANNPELKKLMKGGEFHDLSIMKDHPACIKNRSSREIKGKYHSCNVFSRKALLS